MGLNILKLNRNKYNTILSLVIINETVKSNIAIGSFALSYIVRKCTEYRRKEEY